MTHLERLAKAYEVENFFDYIINSQANGIYRGIKFLFLCHIEDGNTIIDVIKMTDMEHDAIYDVEECIGRGWVFCRNREDALDHADRMWNKSKL